MSEAYPPLFERVPAEIFRPLGVANARKHWALLCRLMTELWGDGGHSPGEEITKSSVIKVIESYLVADDPWEEELETPLAIRAHGLYQVFHESGWLTQRRRGVLDMATVRPVVAQFFTLLCDFANQEPELLGSKVRLIHLSLQAVERGEAGGEMYAEAAKQAKRCIAGWTWRVATAARFASESE